MAATYDEIDRTCIGSAVHDRRCANGLSADAAAHESRLSRKQILALEDGHGERGEE
jgi:hypothetical protein